jgi:Protein of function (DUF2518)
MLTPADFLQVTKWGGILTLTFGAIAALSFLFKWGIRFRLVGVTGFMGVLTGGLFGLSIVPLSPTVVPGSVRYTVVFDNAAAQVAIAVSPTISESELEATLRQAALNQFSPGRLSQGGNFIIRARAVVHPEPGLSQLVYLGQVHRSFSEQSEDPYEIEIFRDRLAQLPKSEI